MWLKKIREAKDESQAVAASKIGISQGYYAAIESGIRGKPLKVSVAKAIAEHFEINWTDFYSETLGGLSKPDPGATQHSN
jgi:transcriptional regulator with XRE-family HTH domain